MFRYDNSEEMKVFLDRVTKCENEQEREMLEQIKHYLDYPEQLSAIHEAESFLSVKLGTKKPLNRCMRNLQNLTKFASKKWRIFSSEYVR